MSAVVLRGDARKLPLPDESVDLIVTSPPFWGQRDYRDGDESMAGQIGAELTPLEYIANLLDCTREWMRVLKPAGSMWVNLGDKFTNRSGTGWGRSSTWEGRGRPETIRQGSPHRRPDSSRSIGRPEKSLIGLPWRYALGCIDDLGLILRQDVIDDDAAEAYVWAKANGMPESVTDRCRRAHEYLFHFVKQPRYFAAIDEIREPHLPQSLARAGRRYLAGDSFSPSSPNTLNPAQFCNPLGRLPGSVWEIATTPLIAPAHLGVDHHAAFPFELPRRIILGWCPSGICTECGQGRFPVTAYTGDEGRHPGGGNSYRKIRPAGARDTNLADAALRARAIIGYACDCTPFTDHEGVDEPTRRRDYNPTQSSRPQGRYGRNQAGQYERVGPWREYHFDAWQAAPVTPATVVDPFGGTGTTALVADVLGRRGIAVELSASYCRFAQWRTTDPGERARAMNVPKPPPVVDGQLDLFAAEA